jgi:polar amino acid transport system substrate-binding protein
MKVCAKGKETKMQVGKSIVRLGLALMVCLGVSGCSTTHDDGSGNKASLAPSGPLRIGITPDYPPMVFKLEGRLAGVEVELARLLGHELNRPIEFVQLRWDDQIPSLLSKRTDLIMSGMSITAARKTRIDFTDPYLRSGQVAMFRAADAGRFDSVERILQFDSTVAVVEGTTGDAFVVEHMPKARRLKLERAEDGAYQLTQRGVELFVHDAPAVVWLVSENETDLKGYWKLLNEEELAWGVRRDDAALRDAVNGILANWKQNGTLDRVLLKWIPYLDKLRSQTAK